MRVVIVAFTIRDPAVLTLSDAQYLRELGFCFWSLLRVCESLSAFAAVTPQHVALYIVPLKLT